MLEQTNRTKQKLLYEEKRMKRYQEVEVLVKKAIQEALIKATVKPPTIDWLLVVLLIIIVIISILMLVTI